MNGETRYICMTVQPVRDESPGGLHLVLFAEVQETMASDPAIPTEKDPVAVALEAQVRRLREQLRSSVGESAASTEELRASNEELQTINEELRSTTEELETSKEELQAVNEELTTVNGELQLKIEETTKVNDDLQNLMVSAEIGSVFVDRELRIKRFTPQAATLFNLLPSDVGRPLLDITHKLDYPQLDGDAAQVLRDLRRIEREIQGASGRSFLVRVIPYRTGEDRIDGVIFTFFDITESRVAKEQLRLSEQRMRSVVESMRDYAILTLDAQGSIATWSPGAERILGYSSEEAVGRHFDMLFTEEDRMAGAPAAELRNARESGRGEDDRWHVHKNGTRVFCSGITTPLVDGKFVGFAKIARDFTDVEFRKRRQDSALLEERTAKESLRQASAMKDEFLAVMSHELKNPLAVIQMNAHLLQRSPVVGSDPKAARASGAITSAVSSQLQIIDDLLDLSRINTGKMTLKARPLDFSELVRDIAQALATDISKKGQTLVTDLAERVMVFADRVRAEQIAWNLLTNAVKFTPFQGSIGATLSEEDGMAKFVVSDSGIGIDPSRLGDVFKMFRQVDAGSSRRKAGLGIGLALVKQLTELHGGRVEAHSEGLGAGSRFEVWLPLAGAADHGASSSSKTGRSLEGLNVLLVDDEPMLLESFAELLTLEGASVVALDNASKAVKQAGCETFDVVVSDIAMPEHDGYWLASQLRSVERTRSLPLVAVSGMAREADLQRAFNAGFDAHVGKPVTIAKLQAEIGAAMARRGATTRSD